MSNGFNKNYKDNFIDVRVNDDIIAKTLVLLANRTDIKAAIPNWISQQDGAFSAYDSYDSIETIDDVTLDPQTTLWAFEKMGVTLAWESGFVGNEDLIVAVLDSGYNAHDDIENVDTTLSYNFGPEGSAYDITDNHGHGTFIVGQIAAALNGSGVNGVCKKVKVVPIKIAYAHGENVYSNYLWEREGLLYAQQINAAVVNMSYGLNLNACQLIQYNFQEYTGVFVTSAGNNGLLMENDETQIGKCNNFPNWIVVGNSTMIDLPYGQSNHSATYVDLFAPGVLIKSTSKNHTGFESGIGTSYSAPFVAAAAALILSHATHLSSEDVCDLLISTVDQIPELSTKCVSGGRLNIYNAVIALYNESRPAFSLGDINGDSRIDSFDYSMARAIVLGSYTPTAVQLLACDVNQDGVVDAFDYQMIRAYTLHTHYFPPV